jgi:hypothetical protein
MSAAGNDDARSYRWREPRARVGLLKRTIDDDRFPLSLCIRKLRMILETLEPGSYVRTGLVRGVVS